MFFEVLSIDWFDLDITLNPPRKKKDLELVIEKGFSRWGCVM